MTPNKVQKTRQYTLTIRDYDTFPRQQYLLWRYRMTTDSVRSVVVPSRAEVFRLDSENRWVQIAGPVVEAVHADTYDTYYTDYTGRVLSDSEVDAAQMATRRIIRGDGVYAVQVPEEDGDLMHTYFLIEGSKVQVDIECPPDTLGWRTIQRQPWGHSGYWGTQRVLGQ